MKNKGCLFGNALVVMLHLRIISVFVAANGSADICQKFRNNTGAMKRDIFKAENNNTCRLLLSPNEYVHGKNVRVNFTCKGGDTQGLRYIKLEAITTTKGPYSIPRHLQGSFTPMLKSSSIFKCDDGYINEIRRNTSDTTLSTNVTWHGSWKAQSDPANGNMAIVLRVTLYDINQKPVLSTSKTLQQAHATSRVRRGDDENFRPISVDSCGKAKNCYRYGGAKCTSENCSYLVTYRKTGDDAEFEISAKSKGWVAIGFSSDRFMGGDDVYACVVTNEMSKRIVVKRYKTHGNWPVEQELNPVNESEGRIHDGVLSCRFTRPMRVAEDESIADLDNSWFYLYAWGPATSGSIHSHYMKRPPRSKIEIAVNTINLRDDVDASRQLRIASPALVVFMTCLAIYIKY